jgi:histidinol-phosphate aminotransferase
VSPLTPQPGILDIELYQPGKSRAMGNVPPVKLSSNESAIGSSPKAIEAYRAVADALYRYPSSDHLDLREALAKKESLEASRIIFGAGSDEILQLVCRAYAGPGDEVLYHQYGFVIYASAALGAGAKPVKAPEVNFTANVDNLLAAVTENTRIVFLANPSNPTGTYVSGAEIERLHKGLPENVLLVIDAAYAEFCTREDYDVGSDLVDRTDNVLVTRTFSKLYGLAGLRLGWGYGSQEVIDVLNRIRGPFNVSMPALAAGLAALDDDEFVQQALAHNAECLPWLTEQVSALGLEVTPSVTNFILIRFPKDKGRDAQAANAYLMSRGYVLRTLNEYGLSDCLRCTIGLADQNKGVVAALRDFVAQAKAAQ